MWGSVNRLILLMRKQRPKEVKQLSSGYTSVKLWDLETDQVYLTSRNHTWMWELDYKAEHQRIDAFELWCWRRLLRVPWNARRSNQSILKETSPEYSLERLMLKLKHQYFGHHAKNWLIGKDPDARKDRRQEEKGTTEDEMVGWHHWLDGHEFVQAPELVMDREAWLAAVHGFRKELDMTEWLNWTELNLTSESKFWSTTLWRQDIPPLMKAALGYTQLRLIRS